MSAALEVAVNDSLADLGVAKVLAAATINATVVKAGPGGLWGFDLHNKAAYDVYVKFFNKKTAPDPSADAATIVPTIFSIKAGASKTLVLPRGIPFGAGISYVITKAVADDDETATVAADVQGVVFYD